MVGFQPDEGDAVSKRGETLALIPHPIRAIRHLCQRIADVQLAAVIRCLLMGITENQITHRLIHHAMGSEVTVGCDVVHGEILGTGIVTLADGLADGRQDSQCLGIVVVVGGTAPEGIFIQLDGVTLHTTIDHGSQSAIAQGQGFHPVVGRLVVP